MCHSFWCVFNSSLEIVCLTIVTRCFVRYVSPSTLATFSILAHHTGLAATGNLRKRIFLDKDPPQLSSYSLLDLDSVASDLS